MKWFKWQLFECALIIVHTGRIPIFVFILKITKKRANGGAVFQQAIRHFVPRQEMRFWTNACGYFSLEIWCLTFVIRSWVTFLHDLLNLRFWKCIWNKAASFGLHTSGAGAWSTDIVWGEYLITKLAFKNCGVNNCPVSPSDCGPEGALKVRNKTRSK